MEERETGNCCKCGKHGIMNRIRYRLFCDYCFDIKKGHKIIAPIICCTIFVLVIVIPFLFLLSISR